MEDKILRNPAFPSGESLSAQKLHTDCCADPLVFAMKDNHHEFSLGLFTVLRCLRLAEKEGFVPELSAEWWKNIDFSYDLGLFFPLDYKSIPRER